MLSSLVTVGLLLILFADFVLVVLTLAVGPRLRRLCQVALWVNGILLTLILCVAAAVLYQAKPDQRAIALLAGIVGCAPTLIAFLSFAAIYRWRMKPGTAPASIAR